jgi:hypothetical protein
MKPTTCLVIIGSALLTMSYAQDPLPAAVPPSAPKIARFASNPLITVRSSPTLGNMVNGPSVIKVPDWVHRPLGKYYMYFANHRGDFIRLAYADAVTGPWKIYDPGVLHVRDTLFYRPQPDLSRFQGYNTHLASPEVYVDTPRRRIVLWSHGWYSNGEHWPAEPVAARRWEAEKGYGQFTQAALSSDGLGFTAQPALTRESYLRVFSHAGGFYAISRLGRLSRSSDPLGTFELGPNPFKDTIYGTNSVRHVALLVRGTRLFVFFSAIGDAPERIMLSTIELTQNWTQWRATTPVEVMRPEAPYECADLPIEPSRIGDIAVPVHQMRDPAILEDDGRIYLFYSICGEQGIAGAEITMAP